MSDSEIRMRLEKSTASLFAFSRWVLFFVMISILYTVYDLVRSQTVLQSERFLVQNVFVTSAPWMDRVGVSVGGKNYHLTKNIPLSVGSEVILERRSNSDMYLCHLDRYRCSKILSLGN